MHQPAEASSASPSPLLCHACTPAGVRDLLPEIEGFEEYWGRGIWVRPAINTC